MIARAAPSDDTPTHREVWAIAWPIILANATVPLLGLADTAVIGRTGGVVDLGAIALGALVFNFLFWTFGFLRMATTSFVANAAGAGNEPEVRASLGRASLLSLGLGVVLIALQLPLAWVALEILEGSPQVEAITRSYLLTRIWGAPAALLVFALMGTLIGLGQSRALLVVQLVMNGMNIALDVLIAGVLGWGAIGVALGTALSEWTAAVIGALWVAKILRARHADAEPFWPLARLRDATAWWRTLRAQADILLRTLFLLLGFGWFAQQGARFGDAILASNHVLLQFISLGAFFLDGFAFAAESLVGRAQGARQRGMFDRAVRRSTELAVGTALALSLALWLGGRFAIDLLTDLEPVRKLAGEHLVYAAVYLSVAAWAFQLDGVFIGTGSTRAMRNAALAALVIFLTLGYLLAGAWGNRGLWLAMIGYAAARGLTLGVVYPRLRRSL